MAVRSLAPGLTVVVLLVAANITATSARAENRDSKLIAQAAMAERIVIGVPEKGGVAAGKPIDIPPGGQFLVQIDRAVTGRRSALVMVVNGGDEKQHPRYIAGRQYVF